MHDEYKVPNMIDFYERYYGYEWPLFSVGFLGEDLFVNVFSEYGRAGYNACIVAYQIIDNKMKLIIRHRTQDNVPKNPERGYVLADINYYYLIELEEKDERIESYCNRIQDINLSEFIINHAEMAETINMKLNPLIHSDDLPIQLTQGDSVKVVNIEKVVRAEYNTYDHWYKIISNGQEYFVFGIFINFSQCINNIFIK